MEQHTEVFSASMGFVSVPHSISEIGQIVPLYLKKNTLEKQNSMANV